VIFHSYVSLPEGNPNLANCHAYDDLGTHVLFSIRYKMGYALIWRQNHMANLGYPELNKP